MKTDIQEAKNAAAREMAQENRLDYEDCKALISMFLRDASEAQLARLEIRPGGVESRKWKNIIHTRGDFDVLDFAEAVATVTGGILAESPTETVKNIIHAGLFFVRVIKKATTIKLSPADGAIILAIHKGKSLPLDGIQNELRNITSHGRYEYGDLSREALKSRLSELKTLGCVKDVAGHWELSETVLDAR